MQIDGAGDEPDFDSVFARDDASDSRDSAANTVAAEAPERPRDEAGRFTSLHRAEVEDAPAPKVETPPEVKPETPQASQPDVPDQATNNARMIPLPELLGERQKRQEAERRMAELQGQLQAFQQIYQQQRPTEAQQSEQQPDWFASPEQAAQSLQTQLQSQFQRQIFETRTALSEELMRMRHSDYDEVSALFAEKARDNPHLLNQVFQHPAPAQFAYQLGKQIQAMTKIGNDPDGYEKRIREEERQKVLAELKAGTVNGGQPRQFPGSLAVATQTGSQGGHLDPQSAADSVFARRV